MSERRGTKALELWCRRITDGYPGVNVQNMTTSWRDGLAFCAMIHHFRPDLIDFDSLNKDDVYGNNELAFRTAAEHLGIPALLDAEDMASCSVPDRLSILTYLSQFYQSFGGSSPSRLALSRTKESSNEVITPVPESTTPKVGPRAGMRRDPCAVCGMPVFLAEKLVVSRTPYHRTCFRCARCENQLTPGNYYETEEGQYCCETCPDEEPSKSPTTGAEPFHRESPPIVGDDVSTRADTRSEPEVHNRSLSDEEKTERRAQLTGDTTKRETSTIIRTSGEPTKYSQTAQMRLNFMANHLLASTIAENSAKSPPNEANATTLESTRHRLESSSLGQREVAIAEDSRRAPKGTSGRVESVDVPEATPHQGGIDSPARINENLAISDFRDKNERAPVASEAKLRLDNVNVGYRKDDEVETRRESHEGTSRPAANDAGKKLHARLEGNENSRRDNTKDKIGPDIDADGRMEKINDEQTLSLVQRRLRMFERQKVEDRNREEIPIVSSSTSPWEANEQVNDDEEEEQDTCDTSNENDDRAEDATINVDEENTSVQEPTSNETAPIGEDIISPVVPKLKVPKQGTNKHQSIKNQSIKRKGRRDELEAKITSGVTVLNASGIDLSDDENYPKDLNPFGNDEDQRPREPSGSSRVSTNPFGSSDEDEANAPIVSPPRPAARNIDRIVEIARNENDAAPTKRRLKAPRINLNPFWSDDDEDHESEDESRERGNADTPVPKPRTIRQTTDSSLSPWKNDLTRGEIYASNSSLASTGSTSTPGGTYRKKKPAPPPPIVKELFTSGGDSLPWSVNALTASTNSLRTMPRGRKAKAAPPPPPLPTSTPCSTNLTSSMTLAESPIIDSDKITEPGDYEAWKQEAKNDKDEANRNKQSMTTLSCDDETMSSYDVYADKSSHGKWKRKKGPAPARPIPHRRKIKVMSLKDVKLELDEIEMQQQGLEKQGVRLEQLIRDRAETGDATEGTSLGFDVEELVLELFALVNEKNELFRRQAELMLLRRQQRLEEEHADIEYQIRCLLCQPEATKTDFDKQREETLIQRLVEIVERRNEIVECLEMDRRREVEEDRSINTQMGIYAAKNKADFVKELEDEESNRLRKSKKTKLKEKAKEKILRKVHKKDADKDVDETEVKLKRQNKKKWF